MRIYLYCLVLLYILNSGCKGTHSYHYASPIFPNEYQVDAKIINDSIMLSFFSQPLVLDSIIILADVNRDSMLLLFHKESGKLLKTIGAKGRGPGELITPTKLSLDERHKILNVFDYAKKSIIKYDLHKTLYSSLPCFEEFLLHSPLVEENEVSFLKDSLYLVSNQRHRLLIATLNQAIAVNDDYLRLPGMTPRLWNSFLQSWSSYALSPDGKKYVSVTSLGGIMEIYDLFPTPQLVKQSFFFEPLYNIQKNQIIPLPETIYCANGITATNDYIYMSVFAKQNPTERPKLIWQFDWTGAPVAAFQCPYQIESFTVDEKEQKIYALVLKDSYEEALVSMDVSMK